MNSDEHERCITTQHEGIVNEGSCSISDSGVAGGQSGFSDAHKDDRVSSGRAHVRRSGAQSSAPNSTEVRSRQMAAQVVVLSGIDKIAKGFYVDRLDLCGQVRASGDLEASRNGDPQNENQRQESGDDDYDGQSHCCSRRSSSRFQISRSCSGSGTADFVRIFWGTRR